MTKTTPLTSGYGQCACRDCFGITVGEPGELCLECDDAGCDGDGECQAPGAYGCDEEPVSRIALLCQTEGSYTIAAFNDEPGNVVPRLLAVLHELAPGASLPTIPAEALSDGTHPAWHGGVAETALYAIMLALNGCAPEGFGLIVEADQIGFYPLAGECI